MEVTEFVFEDNSAHLLDLISFRECADWLNIQDLFNLRLCVDEMISSHPFREAKCLEQFAQILE
jgi:hypothetical protein